MFLDGPARFTTNSDGLLLPACEAMPRDNSTRPAGAARPSRLTTSGSILAGYKQWEIHLSLLSLSHDGLNATCDRKAYA